MIKKIIFIAACGFNIGVLNAQKVYKQAIINTTMNVIAPEDEDVQNLQSGQDMPRGGMNFRNMMDGETKITTYIKGNQMKTMMKSEMGKNAVYRDNNEKRMTMVMEMMGNKMGFTATDDEMASMQKRRDSMMAERRKADTSSDPRRKEMMVDRNSLPTEFVTTGDIKKIAGYNCIKGYLITKRIIGKSDTAVIWYSPEFKVENFTSIGSGMSNMPGPGRNMMPALNGLDKVNGFAMRYEMKMRGGRRMEVEVSSIDFNKEIDDKEFKVPSDIDIKPMKEMQNMFGGGRRENRF